MSGRIDGSSYLVYSGNCEKLAVPVDPVSKVVVSRLSLSICDQDL